MPNLIGVYPDNNARLEDSYSGLIFGILVSLSFLGIIKKNYIKEFERAKMSDRLKSAFLANMSHEIRTPLNAIVGFSSLIADSDIVEDDRQMFKEQIQSNSDYLLYLIEDIIDVSKIESNQLTVNLKEFDVVPMIRKTVQTMQFSIPSTKTLQLVSNLGMSKLLVTTDPIRLEQILRNLLTNAIKFTDKGQIEVNCTQVKEFYVFSVKDSGIGIKPEHQQVIFDRFMKIENSNQHLYRGTGIGLFLSKQLVEMFGGKIWVESEFGEGSTFYFTIPV
jgi:signal transduction histidine kinase